MAREWIFRKLCGIAESRFEHSWAVLCSSLCVRVWRAGVEQTQLGGLLAWQRRLRKVVVTQGPGQVVGSQTVGIA